MASKAKAEPKLKARKCWALLHHAKDLPVIYATREQALSDRMDDEYLVRVWIEEA